MRQLDGPNVRPRLVKRLDALRRARVALIAAPPGYQKRDLAECWLTDNPDVEAIWLDNPASRDELVAMTAERRRPTHLVAFVVADDLTADAAFITVLLEYAATTADVRVIVVSRKRPDVKLGRLAARGQLLDIGSAELAYTRDEIAEIVAERNGEQPEEAIDAIERLSDGWPVVVNLMTTMDLSWAEPTRVSDLMESYIDEEIIPHLSDDDLDLLQDLAYLPQVDPQSVAAITGRSDAVAQLARLRTEGVPISWEERNTITINPMLRSQMLHRMIVHDPERAGRQIRESTMWLRSRGEIVEAVRLAVTDITPDSQLAWEIVGDFIMVHLHERWAQQLLPELMSMLPPDWMIDLVLSVIRGMATPETLIAHLASFDTRVLDQGPTGRLGFLIFLFGVIRRAGYPEDVDLTLGHEMAESVRDDLPVLLRAYVAAAHVEYGLYLLHHDRLDEAKARLLRALGAARPADAQWVTVTSLGAIAFIYAAQGNVEGANRLADEALLLAAKGDFDSEGMDEYARLAKALAAIGVGDYEEARRLMAALRDRADHLPENDALRTSVWSYVYTMLGDPGSALRLVQAYRDTNRPRPPDSHLFMLTTAEFSANLSKGDFEAAERNYAEAAAYTVHDSQPWATISMAQLALLRDQNVRAYEILEPWATGTAQLGDGIQNLTMLTVFGAAAARLGRNDIARDATERSRVLAERLGMNRPSARYLSVLPSNSNLHLTDAERNVLMNLGGDRPLSEVAESLFISPNTLKTHLRRIYKKLGVENREQAVERARTYWFTV